MMSRSVRWLLVPLALTAVTGCGAIGAPAQTAGQSASINLSLTTVPTIRSVTISPGRANFTHCAGGDSGANTRSTAGKLGFPNGKCWVGSSVAGSYPIVITNTGIGSDIDISGSSAAPADGGNSWNLCNAGGHGAAACAGDESKPGPDQYQVLNFSSWGTVPGGISGTPRCDRVFGPGDNCRAVEGMVVTEGLELIGPQWSSDTSTKWTVTITWTPVPGPQR
jgi:hypothetical protein